MTSVNPFAGWLASGDFDGPWVPVAQSNSVLVGGPPWINGCLIDVAKCSVPAPYIEGTTTDTDLGAIYASPRHGDVPPEIVAGDRLSNGVLVWPFARESERPGGEPYFEPLQSFLGHFRAWDEKTRKERQWLRLHAGSRQTIARWVRDDKDAQFGGRLELHRPALLKFLFDTQLHLALFFDVRVDGGSAPDDWREQDSSAHGRWRAWNTPMGGWSQATIHGFHLISPPNEDPESARSNPRESVSFPVAMDPQTGKTIATSFPGPPDVWTEAVGAGDDNYLTSVYFSPSVLERYYADSELYTVSEGQVAAWRGWGLQISRTGQGNLHAYLGDLASLPKTEQQHWAQHAVISGDRIPENRRKTDLEAQWVDGPSHRTVIDDLRAAISRVNSVFVDRCAQELIPPVEEVNRAKVDALRVPANEITAFQTQLLALGLLVNDSLSSKALGAAGAEKVEGEATLKRLGRFIKLLSSEEDHVVEVALKPLFDAQLMRSKIGGAHDASDWAKVLDKLNSEALPWDDLFVDLVERMTSALSFVARTVADDAETT